MLTLPFTWFNFEKGMIDKQMEYEDYISDEKLTEKRYKL
jgi:hypothetical protein